MLFASVIFFLSLLGIVGLFVVKQFEERSQKVLSPNLRKIADEKAIELKERILEKREELSKLPGILLLLSRMAIHWGALEAARFARYLETQAHRLADLVSHKHNFEKKETHSEFLKQVSEHPLRNGKDSGANSGQNGAERL
ncbi:MAG: hypothetical protein Q7S01_02085 [bacterium]|nr:hypothetical protein [bacterium]